MSGARLSLDEEFELLGELGRGGAGVVYAARHRASGREVAIKALLVDEGAPAARERFLRESRIRIDSPYVAQVLGLREEQGALYMIQELVRGASLEETLRQQGALPVNHALGIAEQIGLALRAAHAAGVVHRDVKPANVLLTPALAVKLTDFGLAKPLDLESALTKTGHGVGSLLYVAPEQVFDAKRVGPAADIYGLGATLFHMLTGTTPFKPGHRLYVQIAEDEPPPVTHLRPDCPEPVSALVARTLEKHPDDRPPSMQMLVDRLRELRLG